MIKLMLRNAATKQFTCSITHELDILADYDVVASSFFCHYLSLPQVAGPDIKLLINTPNDVIGDILVDREGQIQEIHLFDNFKHFYPNDLTQRFSKYVGEYVDMNAMAVRLQYLRLRTP